MSQQMNSEQKVQHISKMKHIQSIWIQWSNNIGHSICKKISHIKRKYRIIHQQNSQNAQRFSDCFATQHISESQLLITNKMQNSWETARYFTICCIHFCKWTNITPHITMLFVLYLQQYINNVLHKMYVYNAKKFVKDVKKKLMQYTLD